MRLAYRLAPVFFLPLLFLSFRAAGETVLVINLKDAEVEGNAFQNVQQFWYELGIALDRQEVQLAPPPTGFFVSLSEADRFEAAEALCEKKNAYSAVWLTVTDERIVGFGMVVIAQIGKLGRMVAFDSSLSTPQDTALIAKALLEHSMTYADQVDAIDDGWTSLSEPPPSEPGPAAARPFPPIGKIIDNERPKPPMSAAKILKAPKTYTVGAVANFSRGIASYVGPSTQVGGELYGSFLPIERLFLKLGFGCEAGPFLKKGEDTIAGRSLFPIFGVGVSFALRKIDLDLFADAAATFTKVYVESEGYQGRDVKWWTFTGRLGIGITAPATHTVAFVLRTALSTEYPGLRVHEETETGTIVLKTPLLSFEAGAGIRFLFFH